MDAIGIIRVSSEGQKDKYGPTEQRNDLENKAKELGWNLVDIRQFQESATNPDNRPEFTNLLNEVVAFGQSGAIGGVLFGHPDRLGRDGPMSFFHYLYMMKQLGKVEVRFGQDDIDPADRHYDGGCSEGWN